jgi:hypothetical protein
MKLNGSIRLLGSVVALFGSFVIQARAAQVEVSAGSVVVTSSDDITQAPQLPEGIQLEKLPRSSQAGQKFGTKCYASYLIEKFGYDQSWENDEVAYRVVVTNLGDCELWNVAITDFFPKNAVFERAFPKPAELRDSQATWFVDVLPAGRAVTIKIKFRARDCQYSQWITNNACAWNAMIGQRICAWASTWVDGHRPH